MLPETSQDECLLELKSRLSGLQLDCGIQPAEGLMGLPSLDADVGHVVVRPGIGIGQPDEVSCLAGIPHRRMGYELLPVPELHVAGAILLELVHVARRGVGDDGLQEALALREVETMENLDGAVHYLGILYFHLVVTRIRRGHGVGVGPPHFMRID